ncbi:hypothetical protein MRX96_005586 [Rhipicephalus microplus]
MLASRGGACSGERRSVSAATPEIARAPLPERACQSPTAAAANDAPLTNDHLSEAARRRTRTSFERAKPCTAAEPRRLQRHPAERTHKRFLPNGGKSGYKTPRILPWVKWKGHVSISLFVARASKRADSHRSVLGMQRPQCAGERRT